MIKAKEAKIISVKLDEQILDKINNIVITEARKGNYAADISLLLYKMGSNAGKYYHYLKELGFKIYLLHKGEPGVYLTWD